MNSQTGLRFLRPYLNSDLTAIRKSAYLRFFSSSKCLSAKARRGPVVVDQSLKTGKEFRIAIQERIDELEKGDNLEWPRFKREGVNLTTKEFKEKYGNLLENESLKDDTLVVQGRVINQRIFGRSLAFLDIVQDGFRLQVVLNKSKLKEQSTFNLTPNEDFVNFYHLLRRGDFISICGNPYITQYGELSIRAINLPKIISPCLASLPRFLTDRETRIRNRHVDLLVNKPVAQTLRLRSHIIQHLRNFLIADQFLEVQTPLIADKATGAVAKPFTTVATEFSEKQLALRIAPELWLKRLVIGGMDRVFEIGPAFRNEGLDATHNPEFTTCEFYKAYEDLEGLIAMTENMFAGLAKLFESLRAGPLGRLPELDTTLFAIPFKRISFIPEIERKLGEKLPNLMDPNAEEQLITLFNKHTLPLPTSCTLPRLLDKLSSIYIEPECTAPTFITHHPSCMAPLAKSFLDKKTSQVVSARAELFIDKREIANMYEEENSPFAQREKFIEQFRYKDEESGDMEIDESYCEALEWGLPPTGGWGCGIDRLVMLFSGTKRIGDVLAFGSLRNVVNLGTSGGVKEEKTNV